MKLALNTNKRKGKPLAQQVFDCLLTGRSISALESSYIFKATSMQQRISEMRQRNIPIEDRRRVDPCCQQRNKTLGRFCQAA